MRKYKDNSADWLFFAESDLKVARLALKDKIYHMCCFHSQQAVEKSLKAVLRHDGKIIPRTHSLIKLSKKLSPSNIPDISKVNITYLNRFYILSRYPDTFVGSLPEGLPGEKDAKKALKFAEDIFNLLQKQITEN